jgi:hypothetical protein
MEMKMAMKMVMMVKEEKNPKITVQKTHLKKTHQQKNHLTK